MFHILYSLHNPLLSLYRELHFPPNSFFSTLYVFLLEWRGVSSIIFDTVILRLPHYIALLEPYYLTTICPFT